MADKEYTYSDVSEHNTKKDLFIVVHDKVYNASSFVDEHPYVRSLIALSHSTHERLLESYRRLRQ
jgi:cytochrome b involved in lipid metabolism